MPQLIYTPADIKYRPVAINYKPATSKYRPDNSKYGPIGTNYRLARTLLGTCLGQVKCWYSILDTKIFVDLNAHGISVGF